ncbi:hypothetical protein [Staphylococcus hominis]|uniref:hypothetical protein n=1 Tax=Staphylococcus hominis TaxID=1290 RepID=UPI0011AAED69|nr:hypothetical protein [Staphylococcus hominis]
MKIEMIVSCERVNMVNVMMRLVKKNLKKVVKMKEKRGKKMTEWMMIERMMVETVMNVKMIEKEMIEMKEVMKNVEI